MGPNPSSKVDVPLVVMRGACTAGGGGEGSAGEAGGGAVVLFSAWGWRPGLAALRASSSR
jgi:hypothetical protein